MHALKKFEHDLLTEKHTIVMYDDNFAFNAPNRFVVAKAQSGDGKPNETLAEIHFQEGPINEFGVNGVQNEDLIAIVICRLEHFNQSDFRCRENSMAITKLEEALLWLRKRTLSREKRGVEGTHIV